MTNDKGWPRPTLSVANDLKVRMRLEGADMKQTRLPLMYVSGTMPSQGVWAGIDGSRMAECIRDRVCIVCGERYRGDYVVARLDNQVGQQSTWGHPRCILLAVVSCPHFRRQGMDVVAYTAEGEPLSYEALRQIAKT